MSNDDRDFFEEGVEAYMSGLADVPPKDVSDCGLTAEAEWIDGYEYAESGDDDIER